jgi:hypothetical protein
VAEPRDLKLFIYGIRPGLDGFPYVVLILQNVSSDKLIIPYAPGSVAVRCGDYLQPGPGETFRLRREILAPNELIVLAPPAGGWSQISATGTPDLIVPQRLPAGEYEVYATFTIPTPSAGTICSDSRQYKPE